MVKSCAAEMSVRSSESGQDYAAVEFTEAVGSQLPLLSQPRNHFLESNFYGNRKRSFRSWWFDYHPWLHYSESIIMNAVFCRLSLCICL